VKSIKIEVHNGSLSWQRDLACKVDELFDGEAAYLRTTSGPRRMHEAKAERLLIVRHQATGLIPTSERGNTTSSEIVLGFTLGDDYASSVYAYLPIQDYGFPVSTLMAHLFSG